jgi:hypothetical protein
MADTEVGGLDFLLQPVGDGGAEYRFRNDLEEIEREVVIDRGEDIFIGCDLLPVIHGQTNPDSGTPASLLVFDFRFQSNRRKKRFLRADIRVIFADEKEPGSTVYDPIVKKISFAPLGQSSQYTISPTTTTREVERVVSVSGSGGQLGISLTAGYTYSLKETIEESDAAMLVAPKRVRTRMIGKKNSAEWTLLENSSTRSGIPTFMRVGILLERPMAAESRRFTATVSVDAELNVGSHLETIRRFFGKKEVPAVDPIIFDPQRQGGPSASMFRVERASLDAANMEEIAVILADTRVP